MKKIMLICVLLASTLSAMAWTGVTPEAGKSYYMYNVGLKGFLTTEGTLVDDVKGGSLWAVNYSAAGNTEYFSFSCNGSYIWMGKKTSISSPSTEITTDDQSARGYQMQAGTTAGYKIYYVYESGLITKVTNYAYFGAESNSDKNSTIALSTTASENNDWLFISEDEAGYVAPDWQGATIGDDEYYLYNVGYGGFLTTNANMSKNPQNAWTFTGSAEDGYVIASNDSCVYMALSLLSPTAGVESGTSSTLTAIESTTTEGAYKFVHEFTWPNNTRYLNVEKTNILTPASTMSVNNDWLLITKSEYDAQRQAALDEFEVYREVSTMNPDTASVSEINQEVYALKQIYTIAPMSISSAKYGTFIAPFDVTLPEGVTAYTCHELMDDEATLILESVGETIPANTPVITYCESVYKHKFVGISTATENTYTEGLMVGVLKDTDIDNGYVLQMQDSKVGFYQIVSTKTIPANRCYLTVAGSVQIKGFVLSNETATAITGVETGNQQNNIFDLAGRRVNKAGKGIYIVNGKKVLK